jgi:hypothetical protein
VASIEIQAPVRARNAPLDVRHFRGYDGNGACHEQAEASPAHVPVARALGKHYRSIFNHMAKIRAKAHLWSEREARAMHPLAQRETDSI